MKAIIHVGMPKTGSSSIQDTFVAADVPGFRYLPWRHANHGSLISLFFEDKPERHGAFSHQSDPAAAIEEQRREWAPKLDAAFRTAPEPNIIISAERLSNPDHPVREPLRDYLARYCDSFHVIGYVRPPASFLESAFQQWVKTGKRVKTGKDRDFRMVRDSWPDYRRRFEAIDTVFGRDNVELVKFSRETLYGGDVVVDFARRIGAELAPEEIVRSNERLSLEAVALLYVYRRFGQKSEVGTRADRRLVRALSRIGTSRFAFSADLTASVQRTYAADLDWMETRLGAALREAPRDTPRAIGSEDNLIAVALENAGAVGKLLEEAGGSGSAAAGAGPLARLTADLDRLLGAMAPPADERRRSRAGDARRKKRGQA